ncbi:type II secretion system F family protein [Desulfopila inferna]|uniref:type II secretion system F family protein n=1 Tax=Desulfopila inferna TaxID=468528 RepID=UPI001963DFCE|nr:type II secretion system F family protein [Desulfopila inferna]MBM9603821.1 type II secretion system F family protein [Desulfopila inferna]
MENTPLILAGVSFLAILFLSLALSSFLSTSSKKRAFVERIEKMSSGEQGKTSSGSDDRAPGKKGLFARFGKGKEGTSTEIYTDTPLFYQWAGIYNKYSIRYYQTLRYILLLAPLLLLAVSHFIYLRPFNSTLLLGAIAAGCVGFFLPVLWLRLVGKSRNKELNRAFPDAMDLLMVCVEAGMGIDSAIRRVSQEIHITSPELAKEFKILSLELKTGKSRNECLKNLARRSNLPDVDNLVNLLIQADKYGTGVANALRIHADEMRQKRYSRLEEMAAKLPIKLVVPLIVFIFPAMFVVIAGSAAIQVFRVLIQG